MNPWFERNRLSPRQPISEAIHSVEERIGRMGLNWFAYILLKPPLACRVDIHSTAMTNYPEQWVERYKEQGYVLIDPIFERASRENRPFFWTADSNFPDLRQRRIYTESREFGIAHRLVFPVRDMNGAFGIFTGATCCEERARDAARHHGEELLAAAWDSHEFAMEGVLGAQAGDIGDAGLTRREKECLLWTLEGKTANETAKILGLSVFTVNRHASNATCKLGSLNKHHAAIQAFRAGLI